MALGLLFLGMALLAWVPVRRAEKVAAHLPIGKIPPWQLTPSAPR
jgi:hypothetical protein